MTQVIAHYHFGNCVRLRFCSARRRNGVTFVIDFSDVNSCVNIRHATCSKKDHFCKKTGREVAFKKNPVLVSTRDIPKYICGILSTVIGYKDTPDIKEYEIMRRFM